MKIKHLQRAFALIAMAALAACGGGGNGASTIPAPGPSAAPNLLSRIVGVGDSLTAGYQSAGWLGATTVPNPLLAGTPYAGAPAPFGQENGWWSLLYQQAQTAVTGMPFSPLTMAGPTSPLPLIAGPGFGNEIVPANPATTGLPFGSLFGNLPGAGCKSNDQAAYNLSTVATTLLYPNATPLDLGIPGLTIHEEIAMHQPLVSTCVSSPSPSIAAVQSAVGDESEDFWPVLHGFTNLGSSMTPLSAAVSLKPTLATVWLGANDLLKYAFSAGQWQGDDTTEAQVQSDMTTIITQLKGAGAKVVVANIPDILVAPQFFTVQDPAVLASQLTTGNSVLGIPDLQPAVCTIQANAACTIELFATSHSPTPLPISLPEAQSLVNAVSLAYGLCTPGSVAGTCSTTAPSGYLTETGMLTTIATLGAVISADQALLANPTALAAALTGALKLDPNGTGTGLGSEYFTPAWAAQVQAVNDNINNGILAAAQATNTPLVDTKTLEDNLSWKGAIGANPSPYFLQALAINPGKCCTLGFGGGILSFDGLHPSDTGYALIANAFIQTINSAYGTAINQVSPVNVYNGLGYFYPDPFAQH